MRLPATAVGWDHHAVGHIVCGSRAIAPAHDVQAESTQLASDRTSCRSPLANQVRLVLHTGAYWLMLTLRDAIPKPQPLAIAEFATLRMRLLKIAARTTETASRVRVAFAAACPEANLFASLARCLCRHCRDVGGKGPDLTRSATAAGPRHTKLTL